MEFLVFRLYGPMMSWGEIAVGGERRSGRHPSRSAVVGLVAAALGIDRGNNKGLAELENSLGVGLKMLSAGDVLRDYHTIQVPKAKKNVVYQTRRDELKANYSAVGTLLSSREYRTDSLCIVALWLQPQAVISLDSVMDSLKKPVFHLYLGRKSCPVASPLQPQLLDKASLRAALDSAAFLPLRLYGFQGETDPVSSLKRQRLETQYFWEKCVQPGMDVKMETIRYDRVVSRERWQFAPRTEYSTFPEPREGK